MQTMTPEQHERWKEAVMGDASPQQWVATRQAESTLLALMTEGRLERAAGAVRAYLARKAGNAEALLTVAAREG